MVGAYAVYSVSVADFAIYSAGSCRDTHCKRCYLMAQLPYYIALRKKPLRTAGRTLCTDGFRYKSNGHLFYPCAHESAYSIAYGCRGCGSILFAQNKERDSKGCSYRSFHCSFPAHAARNADRDDSGFAVSCCRYCGE